MIKSVIFDIDGTMLDSEYANQYALRDTILELTHEDKELQELAYAIGIPGDAAMRRAGIEDIALGLCTWKKNTVKYAHDIKLFDGIENVVSELQSRGYGLGIISSKTPEEYRNDFAHLGPASYFGTKVLAGDTPNPKPSPEPMLRYLQLTGTNPDEAMYIGDTFYDMQCAHGAGVKFGLALWGSQNPEGIRAEYYFDSPADILHALGSPLKPHDGKSL